MKTTEKLTVQQVYEDIKAGLQGLAKALQMPAKHVYKIFVRQRKITGWLYLIPCILPPPLIFCAIYFTNYSIKKEGWEYIENGAGMAIFFMVFSVIASIAAIVTLIQGLQYILNPEYEAIMDVSKLIKRKK
ncbi:MAG: hypothetical protein ACFFC1_12610 [Promethearchaeota archaeon]